MNGLICTDRCCIIQLSRSTLTRTSLVGGLARRGSLPWFSAMASRSNMSKFLTLAALHALWEFACQSRVIVLTASVARAFPGRLTWISRHLGISWSGTASADGPDVFVSEGIHVLFFILRPSVIVGQFLDVL